jgi:virulence-associated protein VapD
MYAIVFDLDATILERRYPSPSLRDAYREVSDILRHHGFVQRDGASLYVSEAAKAVDCVLAVQDLSRLCAWFAPSVLDIRMLRIDEESDLSAALR